MALLEAIIGFLLALAANGATQVARSRWQRRLDQALADADALDRALTAAAPLRSEVSALCAQLARNRGQLGLSPRETALWRLLSDDIFQADLAEWLMAGGLEEGDAVKQRLTGAMTAALSAAGAPEGESEFLRTTYFEALDRAVFSNPVLAHWRHQLSLSYLRDQVASVRRRAEEAAGVYSRKKQESALDRYCEKALNAWDIIDLSNLPEGDVHIVTQKLLLRQLYVPLRIRVEMSPERADDDAALSRLEGEREARRLWEVGRGQPAEPVSARPEERRSVGERLSVARRLVVLGDPGGGKTTMMRWMATAYLLRYRDESAYHEIPDVETLPERHWIPVLIRCRDLGEADLCRSFPDFLTQHLKKTELLPDEADVMKAVILDCIAKGEALLLVDGLDEITDPQVRRMFCQELERTAARYPEAHIAVTSRIVGYRDMPYRMATAFEHGVIADLTRDDKDLFARRWIEVTEQYRPAAEKQKRARELLEALHSSERIERLTGNPMLLTTLALVKRKVGKLPSRRTKLYAEAVSVLLNWNPQHYETIDEEEAIPQLEFLAYEMCRQGVQSLTEDEVLNLLDTVRQEYPNVRAIRRREPQAFLKLLEARSSILMKSGGLWPRDQAEEEPVWEFRHLTFQEYLAARALFDGRYPNRDRAKTLAEQVAPLAGSLEEPPRGRRGFTEPEVAESWQEVLRLLVAECKDDDVDDVLRAIATPMPDEDPATMSRPRAILAARCLADEPNASEQVATTIIEDLVKHVSQTDGSGRVRTRLDETAIDLARSLWAPLLKECLFRKYRDRGSSDGWREGALLGVVETADTPHDGPPLKEWVGRLPERIRSGDEMEATAAALATMRLAFDGRVVLVPGLVDSLLSILQLNTPACEAAAWALGWLSRGSRRATVRQPYWQPKGDEVLSLIRAFEASPPSSESSASRYLAWSLGASKDPRAVGSLVAKLDDPEGPVRIEVVRALAKLGETEAVPPLIAKLDDPEERVRIQVVEALAELGETEAVPPLIAKLDDPEERVRIQVVEALAKLGDTEVVPPLIAKLDDPEGPVRVEVVRALAKLGDTEVVPRLIAKLDDPEGLVRIEVVRALVALGDSRAVSALIDMVEASEIDERVAAAAALDRLGEARGATVLDELLQDAGPDVRRRAVEERASYLSAVDQALLARDMDAAKPWIDPLDPITKDRVAAASRGLGMTPEEVRSHYEALAADFHLRLGWKDEPAADL